jgi:hypothetical protein
VTTVPDPGALTVRPWTPAEFDAAEAAWDGLLAESDADPLFLDRTWLAGWWRHFSDAATRLNVLAAYHGERLVGIAPLFRERVRLKGFLAVDTVQFIGNRWRGRPATRTEHLDFIVARGLREPVVRAFLAHLARDRADLVLSDLELGGPTHRLLAELGAGLGLVRQPDRYESFEIALEGDFDAYVKGLGRNTRLHLFNRRKYVEGLGKITLRSVGAADLDDGFATLNALHRVRWGRPVFEGDRLAFHREAARTWAEAGDLDFSILYLDDRPLSALYNVRAGDRAYNLQAGLDDTFDRKVALGFLHHGYRIEDAFARGLAAYDFLGGGGMKGQFKHRMANVERACGTLHVVRGLLPRLLFAAWGRRRAHAAAPPAEDA